MGTSVAVMSDIETTPVSSQDIAAKISTISKEEREKRSKPEACRGLFLLIFMMAFPCAIGTGIACAIHYGSRTELYQSRIAALASDEQHYPFLSVVFFGMLCRFVNFYPSIAHKSRFLKMGPQSEAAIIMATIDPDGTPLPVAPVKTGAIGEFNRATRALGNFSEWVSFTVMTFLMASRVYPIPCFVCMTVYCVFRCLYPVGISKDLSHPLRGIGFGLSFVATATMEGLCLLVFCLAPATP